MDGLSDLAFFTALLRAGSLAALAREQGVTPPVISRRLAALEARLGLRLLQRTTRRMHLTQEGELYAQRGQALLDELQALEADVAARHLAPRGLLRVNASFGFGRCHIAPAVSDFARCYPQVGVQLTLTDRPMNLVETGLDLGIRVGGLPDSRDHACRLAANRRLLCAAPDYLARCPAPTTPEALGQHQCIVIRENNQAYGNWQLRQGHRQVTVKVDGALSTNDGSTALAWGLAGHGILLRSTWEIAPLLRSGQLIEVLPHWQFSPADVYAVYPQRAHAPAKLRVFIDFLLARFAGHRGPDPQTAW